MAVYECQNFKDGQVLTAACLNKIEEALQEACNKKVTSAVIDENGNLKIIFADETELDCGCVASSNKVIESVVQTEDGALTFTYTDGTTYVVENVGGGTITDEQIETAVENYLAENPIGGSEQIQADYSQNDSTAKDYIKNRPFHEGEPITTEFPLRETLLEQQTLSDFHWSDLFGGIYIQDVSILAPVTIGETYKVLWDNEEYVVTAQDTNDILSNSIAFGDLSSFGLTGNNEPFVMVWRNDALSVIPLTDTEATPHDVAIYKEPVFIYTESDGAFAVYDTPSPEMLSLWKSDWKSCVFTWDGVEYTCEPQIVSGIKCIGNVAKMMGTGDSGEPFIMMCADASLMGADTWSIFDLETEITDTTEEGATVTHEVGLVINVPNITKLDPKYLENIDYETQLINKPFGTTPSGTVLFDDTVVCESDNVAFFEYVEIIEGVTYTVEVDGTVYTAVAAVDNDSIVILLDTESDYMIVSVGRMTALVYPEGEHAVKIALAEDVVKKIDGIYLPDGISGGGLPEVTTDDNDKIIQVVDGAYQVVALENSAVKTYIDNYINEALGGEY